MVSSRVSELGIKQSLRQLDRSFGSAVLEQHMCVRRAGVDGYLFMNAHPSRGVAFLVGFVRVSDLQTVSLVLKSVLLYDDYEQTRYSPHGSDSGNTAIETKGVSMSSNHRFIQGKRGQVVDF